MNYSIRKGFMQALDNANAKQALWFTKWICKWVILILCVILYTLVVSRAAEAKAERKYEAWKTRFAEEYAEMEEAKTRGIPKTPMEMLLESESEALARVLYGIKGNSTDDLKTACWCVLNRVDNALYPNSVEEVVAQKNQWVGYSDDNPVLDSLYKIAREQLEVWHDGTRRPVSSEFVYLNWTPFKVTLRDRWEEKSGTEYWRYS